MGKIKILYYEPSSGFGGSSRCLKDWLLKLDMKRFQPFVVVLDDGPVIKGIEEIGKEIGFDVVTFVDKKGRRGTVFTPALIEGYWNFFLYIFKRVLPITFKLAKYIKKNQIDLVHINTPIITGLEAILAAKISSTPTICHLHHTRKWSHTERIMARWVSKFICLTDEGMKLYQKYVNKNKLIKIYNGIDLEKSISKNNFKKEFKIDVDYKIIGIVGRIVEGKGHDIFLKAAKIVISECPNAMFIIVGDGEKKYKNSFRLLSKELGIADEVIFTGWREDALNIISNMDILVQASDTFPEGFALTCIEAMSLGVPLVVTDIPGPSEIVINGKTGFIVPPGKPEPMAEAIINIIEDKELANRFGNAGKQRAIELFDINKIVNQIEHVYLDLVSVFK